MKEKNKKKINKNTKKIIVTILLIIIASYILYAIYLLVKDPTDIFTVEEGTLLSEESTVGYIIRDETVLQGENYKNGMVQIATENQKVSKNENVFRYYSDNEEQLINKINDLDTQIQNALENETNIFSTDIKQLEKQIDEKTENLYKMSDIQKIDEYKKEINDLVSKKAKIAGESSPSRIKNKEINNRKKQI